MTAIGENIKRTRKKLGITQEELAEKLSVTRQAVSNWENGKTEPDLETISAIAEVFKIDSYELINNETAKKYLYLWKEPIFQSCRNFRCSRPNRVDNHNHSGRTFCKITQRIFQS